MISKCLIGIKFNLGFLFQETENDYLKFLEI